MVLAVTPGLERRLRAEVAGEVLFDPFSRGRYATDASHYQVTPVGVVVPRDMAAAEHAIALARQEGISVLPRGGGTSQCGQTVNESLVIDCSRHLTRILELDVAARRCVVEPGIVLDDLNRALKPHGLWFPVDISTSSRATIGGMAANNSCGGRSLRYGTTRDNLLSIDAILADGTRGRFGPVGGEVGNIPPHLMRLARDLLVIGKREADEIAARFPKVQRRVGGYNLDAIVPGRNDLNLAHILVGSEGTLAFSTAIELKLWPLLGRRAVGACHFGSFHAAMDAAQHIVKLGPIAVELVDRTMLELAGGIAMFRPALQEFVRGTPDAVLLTEFAEDDHMENVRRLTRLHELMDDLGFGWEKSGAKWGGVVDVLDARLQAAITDIRTSGLNIMMSMKDEGKPVSFVEDCAVPLEHLAEYTANLTAVFERHGTRGTWYAHASVGCLHVRPILNLRLDQDLKAMRAIAEEAFALVKAYKGSHSGEHGDGIVRSEFHATMFGEQLVRAFEEVKDTFDPNGLFNPGRIVRAPKFDERALLRYGPGYHGEDIATVLDWSAYPGAGGGFQGAIEMCNNNGACRKSAGGVMCPSYMVTRNERDVTRGRANTLRLAVTGQLGPDALTADDMAETLKLCVSCKGCRRECPTGVDMARMKIEVQAARAVKFGLSWHDRLVGYLPRYAPWAAQLPWLVNLRDQLPFAAQLSEKAAGFSAKRSLPKWRRDWFRDRSLGSLPRLRGRVGEGASHAGRPIDAGEAGREVILFVDTFNRYFEPETIEAALQVLAAAGYQVHVARPAGRTARPLCCGRTFLSVGKVDEARRELERVLEAVSPFTTRGVPVIGLEPSCILGFRDELPAVIRSEAADRLAAHALTFEEFLAREPVSERLAQQLGPLPARALVHGHCHQKAFGAFDVVTAVLKLVPRLEVAPVESSCCGMAGSFGYDAETIDVSLAMGELSLLPAVRRAEPGALIVADGTSCRHQIKDGTGRAAMHVSQVLAQSLAVERTETLLAAE